MPRFAPRKPLHTKRMAASHEPAWLEGMYNNLARVKDHPAYFERWVRDSAAARDALPGRIDLPYGAGLNETLDVFPAPVPDAPVLVFIHGGYWRAMDKSQHSFIAPAFNDRGICVVVPNYALCPGPVDQPVTVPGILLQMVRALEWTWRHIAAYGDFFADVESADTAAIDRMLNLNVNVVMKNVHDVLPHMIARGSGDIIVTSSLAAHFPTPWEPVYASSKWAINCFVQTVRRQVFKHGIRVGSISPGPVVTSLLADWPPEKLKEARETGSLLEASDVAEVVMFMLTRPRGMTIRDVVMLPTNFDL